MTMPSVQPADKNIYEVTLKNSWWACVPVIIQWDLWDGPKRLSVSPRKSGNNESEVKKSSSRIKKTSIVIDPNLETADINVNDNVLRNQLISKFDALKKGNN